MTTPTQTQIEAAAKAIEAATISLKDFSKWSEVAATAALTAAAEVDKSELEKQYDHNADLDREIERLRSELASAIERCAQVAIKYGEHASNENLKGVCAGIAAAIRASGR